MSTNRGCLTVLFPFLRKADQSDSVSESGGPEFSFSAHDSLLSPAERSFYGVLLQAVQSRYTVFAKVRMCDVLKHGTRQSLNKISQKHVDFLLCTIDDIAPVLAIELDDKSHKRSDRRERDVFVDQAFAAAELPILHFPAQRSYAVADVTAAVRNAIGLAK